MREKEHQDDGGQIKDHAHDNRGEEQRHGRDRRHLVTPQNIFLALLHGAHTRAEESAAQNANGRHHCDHNHACASLFCVKGVAENEEEHQRKEIVEEQNRPVPHREL